MEKATTLASGACLSFATLSLFNLVSHAKYVCSASSDDNSIVAIKVIECFHVITAVALCTAAVYRDKIEKLAFAIIMGASTLIFVLMLIMKLGGTCSDDCLNGTTDDFREQVQAMLGVPSVPDVMANPAWFKVPENYCRANLLAVPGTVNDYATSKAETCLAWACSGNFVPGSGTLWYATFIGLILQAATAVTCFVYDKKVEPPSPARAIPSAPPAQQRLGAPDTMDETEETPPFVLKPRKRSNTALFYKPVPTDFSF